MDWAGAAELNRVVLLRIVTALFTLARIAPGERPELDPAAGSDVWMTALPRYVYRMVMLILEPAEAAMRRLLIIAAKGYGLQMTPRPSRAAPVIVAGDGGFSRVPGFSMFDPMKTFEDHWRTELQGVERLPFPGQLPEPQRFSPVNAIALWHRINALHAVVTNLRKSAQRYARWKARQEFVYVSGGKARRRSSLMRPGPAPGWRRKPVREIDAVLRECHMLARDVLSPQRQRWG